MEHRSRLVIVGKVASFLLQQCGTSARITGGLGGLAPVVQALPQIPIIGWRSAIAIRPPENFLIIRPLCGTQQYCYITIQKTYAS